MERRFFSIFFVLLTLNFSAFAFKPVESGIVKGTSSAKKLVVDISGQKQLFLIATDGGDTNGNDHAVWGNPTLIDASGKKTPLSKMKKTVMEAGWSSVTANKTPDKKPLKIKGKKFKKGYFAHAPSVLGFKLKGKFAKLEVEVGIQEGNSGGSCNFIVSNKHKSFKPEIIPEVDAVELAIKDLSRRFGSKYPNGKKYLSQLSKIKSLPNGDEKTEKLISLQRKALLENPLLKRFSKIVAVRREKDQTCTPGTFYSLHAINPKSGSDEIVTISNLDNPKLDVLYKPAKGGRIVEMDLHFDGKKILYSGVGSEGRWHLHEIDSEGSYIGQVTSQKIEYDSFDGCYLPNGKITYSNTASMQGLPCESGRKLMANTYLLDPKTKAVRRLTFDQDTNWNTTVLEDGKVQYLRWEYSDQSHFFSRVLMTMNPDGTAQKMRYGTNSYWPNTLFDARPIPGSPSKFVAIVTGHHTKRAGRLCLFDVRKGYREDEGAVQFIPGYKEKIVPEIEDYLYNNHYPKMLYPHPLGTKSSDGSGKYFLTACKPTKNSLWGIYLVDIYNNMVKIAESDGRALLEPIPLMKRKRPPVIPEQVNLKSNKCQVYIANIYEGGGLEKIPKGTVKNLRLFTYHYSYYKSGSHEAVGCEGSWDVKRILGTVPVNPDGSVLFEAPANTPISIQPVDENGAALQIMRSWFNGMPGETVSCVGCHEPPSMAPSMKRNMASNSKPVKIQPWYGPQRNMSFLREVQPVLAKRCISCHNPSTKKVMLNGKKIPDFKTLKLEKLVYEDKYKSRGNAGGGPFSVSYNNLNPYVRRPGPESDIHMFKPMEYHASTSPLLQILDRGHHGVELTKEERERLVTWIDFNVPFWGSWTDTHRDWANEMHRQWSGSGRTREDQLKNIEKYQELRKRLQKQYANIADDFESDQYSLEKAMENIAKIKPVTPKFTKLKKSDVKVAGWPFDAKQKQGGTSTKSIKIDGKTINFRKIPSGSFVMGTGSPDAVKRSASVETFWMADKELSNELFKLFKADHDSRYIDEHSKDHIRPGIPANEPKQPVVRVSWHEAVAFTKWLSDKTGKEFRLPTEVEWEYAARAGSDNDFYWGDVSSDFSKFANLADKSIEKFNARQTFNFLLREDKYNDKAQIQVESGKYKPNGFGLYDMIGNVSEWTSSSYGKTKRKVTRGGSWYSLPHWANARVSYEAHQKVFNVGIRLVLDEK